MACVPRTLPKCPTRPKSQLATANLRTHAHIIHIRVGPGVHPAVPSSPFTRALTRCRPQPTLEIPTEHSFPPSIPHTTIRAGFMPFSRVRTCAHAHLHVYVVHVVSNRPQFRGRCCSDRAWQIQPRADERDSSSCGADGARRGDPVDRSTHAHFSFDTREAPVRSVTVIVTALML